MSLCNPSNLALNRNKMSRLTRKKVGGTENDQAPQIEL